MKTMKTSIVLKLLTGVTTAVLTVTGISVSVTNGPSQNMEDVSVINETDSQVAAAITNAKITNDEINIIEDVAEEIMTKSKYIINDEQSTDVALADVQSDNAVVAADKQKPDIVKKSDIVKESDIEQRSDAVKESDIVKKSDTKQQSDIVEESAAEQQTDIAQQPNVEQKSDIPQQSNDVQQPSVEQKSDIPQQSDDVQQPSVEQKSDIPQQSDDVQQANIEQQSDILQQSEGTAEQTGNNGNPHKATDTVTCIVTGIVPGNPDVKVPDVPEISEVEVPVEDEDCVVGHRYCVCGASFDIRKNSGLDGAWNAHVSEHAANGDLVRWTDK